jgi:hypothetical protein
MDKKSRCNRRDFLKKTAVGTAGLTAGLSLLKPSKARAAVTWPTGGWPAPTATPNTMQINPNINNLRVVCMFDPNMITNPAESGTTVDDFVNAVSMTTIDTDMDNMAMWLAQQTTPAAAWSTIFQKPASKTWAQVKVAIKVNTCNAMSQPRPPVVGKICNVLNGLGVPGTSIIIYDGAQNTCQTLTGGFSNYFSPTGTGTYNGYTKYPGTVSSGTGDLGGSTNVAIPNVTATQPCPTDLANGTIDILINIAVNKGHNSPLLNSTGQGNTGGCTLCHKNHLGTFPASIFHNNGTYSSTTVPVTPANVTTPSTADNSIFMGMTAAIVGGTPARQQLCIIDSLWADNNGNPNDAPTLMPARLVMGTFAGAVDYLTCTQLKNSTASETIGGHTFSCGGPDANLDLAAGTAGTKFAATGQVLRFLTLYGYKTTDPNLAWVAITPASVYTPSGVLPPAAAGGQPHTLEVGLAGSAAVARFELPASTSGAFEVRMFDIGGRSVRKIFAQLQAGRNAITWDGNNDRGRAVAPGTYEVRVIAQHYLKSGRIAVE